MYRYLLAAFSAVFLSTLTSAAGAASRPNFVWVVIEDMSADFRCYGQEAIETPNVDRLAAEGVRFTNAIVTAPVCSAARSSLITGMYQTSIGAHHHRSGRGELKITLPDPVRPTPELFRDAGYQVSNLSFEDFVRTENLEEPVKVAKTDYNFQVKDSLYDRVHWSQREQDQPFFAQIQLHGGKFRHHGNRKQWPQRIVRELGERTPRSAVMLPPYLPSDPVIVEDWAQYLDTVRYADWQVGEIVERLRQAGELEGTYIFLITDHGISHVRNKQFCYEGGVHIPLIVYGPGLQAGETRKDVVEHIDLSASSLAAAGIKVPEWMESRDILSADYKPRRFAFAARDRCDETVDRIRCVRSEQFKYIRNFHPQRPYLQPNNYKDKKPIVKTMRRLHKEGLLNEDQAKILAETRPEEELYDLVADPYELKNLANDPAFAATLAEMRQALEDWIASTGDRGQQPESEAMYDSDMAGYGKRQPAVRANIQKMKRWASEGK